MALRHIRANQGPDVVEGAGRHQLVLVLHQVDVGFGPKAVGPLLDSELKVHNAFGARSRHVVNKVRTNRLAVGHSDRGTAGPALRAAVGDASLWVEKHVVRVEIIELLVDVGSGTHVRNPTQLQVGHEVQTT